MGFAVDHVFVLCDVGAPEADALIELGFREGAPNRHPGQGTANRRFFFENAYLELLWVESESEAGSGEASRTRLLERWKARRSVCPFGVILRGEAPLPFPTWTYQPRYLPAGCSMDVAEGTSLDEPALFCLRTVDRTRRVGEKGAPSDGTRMLTGIALVLDGNAPLSEGVREIERLGLLQFERGTAPALRLEYDRGRRGRRANLEPRLPISVRW